MVTIAPAQYGTPPRDCRASHRSATMNACTSVGAVVANEAPEPATSAATVAGLMASLVGCGAAVALRTAPARPVSTLGVAIRRRRRALRQGTGTGIRSRPR